MAACTSTPSKPCLDRVARCLGVQLKVLPELRNRKFARDHFVIAWFCPITDSEGYGAGSDEIEATFPPEDTRFTSTTKGPKLEVYERAVGVNAIRNLCEGRSANGSVVQRGKTQTDFHPAICAAFQIPGTFSCPAAWGAIKVASVTMSVPGTPERCA